VAALQPSSLNDTGRVDGVDRAKRIKAHRRDTYRFGIFWQLNILKCQRLRTLDTVDDTYRITQVFMDAGSFGKGTECILLHYPNIRTDIVK